MTFRDRTEAGLMLAERLSKYRNGNGVVLVVPRGGVPVGAVIAKELGLPLDIVLVKKIGHPYNKEYAIGSVSLQGRIVNWDAGVSPEYIEEETKRIRESLKEKHRQFLGDRKPFDIEGKIVIIVDDGIATGSTILATIQLLKKNKPEKLIVAVPVASPSSLAQIQPQVDALVCLRVPDKFSGVGQFYEDFEQVSDEEVMRLLKMHHAK